MLDPDEWFETWPRMADEFGRIILKSGSLYKFKNTKSNGGYFSYEDSDFFIENGQILIMVDVQQNGKYKNLQMVRFLFDSKLYYLDFIKSDYITYPPEWYFKEIG